MRYPDSFSAHKKLTYTTRNKEINNKPHKTSCWTKKYPIFVFHRTFSRQDIWIQLTEVLVWGLLFFFFSLFFSGFVLLFLSTENLTMWAHYCWMSGSRDASIILQVLNSSLEKAVCKINVECDHAELLHWDVQQSCCY